MRKNWLFFVKDKKNKVFVASAQTWKHLSMKVKVHFTKEIFSILFFYRFVQEKNIISVPHTFKFLEAPTTSKLILTLPDDLVIILQHCSWISDKFDKVAFQSERDQIRSASIFHNFSAAFFWRILWWTRKSFDCTSLFEGKIRIHIFAWIRHKKLALVCLFTTWK